MPIISLQDKLIVGNIVHFDKFDFKDRVAEADRKGRFGIILRIDNQQVTIATTSASYSITEEVLQAHDAEKGDKDCITNAGENVKCFRYTKGKVVGKTNSFGFPETCYINLHHRPMILMRTVEEIKVAYHDKNNLEFIDHLSIEAYYELVYCIYHSRFVDGRLKKYMEAECERVQAALEKLSNPSS